MWNPACLCDRLVCIQMFNSTNSKVKTFLDALASLGHPVCQHSVNSMSILLSKLPSKLSAIFSNCQHCQYSESNVNIVLHFIAHVLYSFLIFLRETINYVCKIRHWCLEQLSHENHNTVKFFCLLSFIHISVVRSQVHVL